MVSKSETVGVASTGYVPINKFLEEVLALKRKGATHIHIRMSCGRPGEGCYQFADGIREKSEKEIREEEIQLLEKQLEEKRNGN